MSDFVEDARHLTFATLDQLWRAGNPIAIPIQGAPPCKLELDPVNSKIALVADYEAPEPDVSRLQNVAFRGVASDAGDLAELTIDVAGSVHEAYGLLASVADELQLRHASLAAAVGTAVARHKHVLAPRAGITQERELGLFGELLLVEYLSNAVGPGRAVTSWHGPLSEEHDFVFADLHLEVKTTSAERRSHVIHGLSQLLPVGSTPLSLLSIQVTRAPSPIGRTLPGLVADVRGLAGGHVVQLDERLDAAGWDVADSDLYRTHWVLRSQPRAYTVMGDFPAITPDVLGPVVPNFGRVSDVSYRIDLTGLPHQLMVEPITGFVTKEQ